MEDKSEQLSAVGTSRPVRVAYLIDVADCPDNLLDSIFAEAYGRWGGRRTLIVPAAPAGIDTRYGDWLWYFDADIIYSFVSLSDDAVADLHERYAPAHLLLHEERGVKSDRPPSFQIRLPFQCLSSLSVLPAFLGRTWGLGARPTDVRILDKFWDRSESAFLQENFGFLATSFPNAGVVTAHPDLYSCLTLITDESLQNKHYGKDLRARYETQEDALLNALGQPGWLLTPANLSEWFAPFLDAVDGFGHEGTTLVVGNTTADRLLFWNVHLRYRRPDMSEMTSLRIPIERLSDPAFLGRVRQILERRGVRGHNSRNDLVTLRSCSLGQPELDEAAERFRKIGSWLAVRAVRHVDHAACVPRLRDSSRVSFGHGGIFSEPAGQATTEFKGNRMHVPNAMPWHMREAMPPSSLRHGNWMVDIVAARSTDHSRFTNLHHVWVLPRRLRLENAFVVEREGNRSPAHGGQFIRPTREGSLGVCMWAGSTAVAVTTPEDLDALRVGLCNDREWAPFARHHRSTPIARRRFEYIEPSDKGRYLIGVLQRFRSVPGAFAVLMDGYWREVLQHLGGVPVEKNLNLRKQLITTLRKRLNQKAGPLRFETEEQIDRLGREALRFGRMVPRAQRYVDHAWLEKHWRIIVDDYIEKHPKPVGNDDDDARIRNIVLLDRSIQYLCQHEVLFQGREWLCRNCQNRNWVGIDSLAGVLECDVCRHTEPAPVSGDWHFRSSPFLLDAYREHGVEAVIFALWQLSERARRSFYFAPSLRLWKRYPKSRKDDPDAEIDALVVMDGKTFLVEAKTSAALDDDDIAQVVLAAEHIRPDVVLIACMEDETGALRRAIEKLRSALLSGIAVEVVTFKAGMLNTSPYLPS